jgi:S-adenosylmethionine hydrolase
MTEPAPSGVITLLSDFGLGDPFVGVMTGVLLSRFPAARVVDLCHGIRPQAIAEGAFWLERCYCWFPRGTVHVAVVDPGVGSSRGVLAAAIAGHYFLLPDNGLLGPTLLAAPDARVLAVDVPKLGLATPSATFHGRDLFAPLAAGLASGDQRFDSLGVPTVPLPSLLPSARRTATGASGEVVCVDHFGNLITNLDAAFLAQALPGGSAATQVRVAGQSLRWLRTYADAQPGELLALINAFGALELAVRDGSAERRLGVGHGAAVELHALVAPGAVGA